MDRMSMASVPEGRAEGNKHSAACDASNVAFLSLPQLGDERPVTSSQMRSLEDELAKVGEQKELLHQLCCLDKLSIDPH